MIPGGSLKSYLVLISLALTLPVFALPGPKETWIQVDTENFTIFSNANPTRSEWIGRNLEILRDVLMRTTKGFTVESALPTKIYAFRNRAGFRTYVEPDGDPQSNLAGVFIKTSDGNYVAFDSSAGSEPLPTIYHEYLHFFTENTLPNLPLWLTEGFAEFYSTFDWDKTSAKLGRHVDHHLAYLSQNSMIPFSELLQIDRRSADYNEGKRRGTFYAQSWALTHYIMMLDKGESMNRLAELLNRGTPSAEAFAEVLGEPDLAALQKKVLAYTRAEKFSYFVFNFSERLTTSEPTTTPLERVEMFYQLGDLVAHMPPVRYDRADEHFQAALELAPMHGPTWVSLGIMRGQQGREADAIECYLRAIALDPTNDEAYAAFGQTLLRRLYDGSTHTSAPPDLLRARQLLAKSLEFQPDDPERLAGFGSTFVFDEEGLDPGISALVRAAGMLPARVDILLDLLNLYVNAGYDKTARLLLDNAIRHRAEPDILARAEDVFLRLDLNRAVELFEQGQDKAGKQLLEASMARAHSPGLAQAIRSQLESLEGQSRVADGYDAAIEKANAGDLQGAIDQLRDMIAESNDASFKEQAADTVSQMLAALRRNQIIDLYNSAISSINAGEIATAISALKSALHMNPEPELRNDIENILKELRPDPPTGRSPD